MSRLRRALRAIAVDADLLRRRRELRLLMIGQGGSLLGSAVTLVAILSAAGASDAVSAIFRGTIWNEVVPDRMRGRLAGMEMISYTAGPTLGNVEAGLDVALPGLWRYESEAMKAPA